MLYSYIKKLLTPKEYISLIQLLTAIAIQSFASLYPVLLIQRIVDMAVAGKSADVIPWILKLGGIYLLIQVINSILISLITYKTKELEADLAYRAQNELFQSLSRTRIVEIVNHSFADLNNTLTGDTQYVSENSVQPLVTVVGSALKLVFGLYFLSRISWELTLIVLPLGILSTLILRSIRRKTLENQTQLRNKTTTLWETITEGLRGFVPLKIHRRTDSYGEQVKRDSKRLKDVQIAQGKLEGLSFFMTHGSFMVTIGLLLISSAIFVVQGRVSIGGLTAILMYNHMITDPLLLLLQVNQQLSKLSVSIKRIQAIEALSEETAPLSTTGVDEIRLDRVNYGYGDGEVVKDYSLQIVNPASIGIFGPSGVGKTTLAHLISSILSPKSGSVEFRKGGKAIDGLPRLSYMVQDDYLFNTSIRRNIELANPDLTEGEYQELVRICKLEGILEMHGEEDVGPDGHKLSGGERKRVLVARTIADRDADIYIFDELSASLDSQTFSEIYQELDSYIHSKTRIYIEHNASIRSMVDIVIDLDSKSERNLV